LVTPVSVTTIIRIYHESRTEVDNSLASTKLGRLLYLESSSVLVL